MAELYLFNVDGTNYGFNPLNASTTLFSIPYTYTNIVRSEIQITESFSKSTVSFKFPRDHSFALMLLQDLTEIPIITTIYRDSSVYWKGRVKEVAASDSSITINCISVYSYQQKDGFSPKITIQCRHRLYEKGCNVVKEAHGINYSVSGIISKQFTVSGLSGSAYKGGTASINGQIRNILNHSGNTITLSYPFNGSQSGTLRLYPGCALTVDACIGFSNLNNFGGFPFMPITSPFSSAGAL